MLYRVLPVLLLVMGGCVHRWDADPMLKRELGELSRALGSGPSGDTLALEYEVEGHDGPWRWEIVLGPGTYAERRSALDRGTAYAFGDGPSGAWLSVGDGPRRSASPEWRRLARTQASIWQLWFLRPADAEEAVYLPHDDARWEYAYRPRGGRTLTFLVDDEADRPLAWDVLDELGRLSFCDDVSWVVRHGRYVPGAMSCGAVNGRGRRTLRTQIRLVSARRTATPAWARTDAPVEPPPCATAIVEAPITDERSISLAVESRGVTLPFVLDSGAWHTYLDAETARVMGVVPTGEVPIYVEPPWLPSGSSFVGVADRISVEGVPIDGARVLVMDGLGAAAGTAGLLGADFFRRFVVDVDTPRRVVRLVPHERYEPPADSTPMFLHGTLHGSMMVTGEITGVARGPIILDTGARNRVVVHHFAMAAENPRHRGESVGRWYGDMVQTPDYLTEVGGLELGPFSFPEMPAWGRDRERERMGGGIALVGMGTMRHLRMTFDLRNRTVYASAGPGYQALARSGLELDDSPDGGAYVTHVVPGSPAAARGIRTDDTLVGVNGVAVYDAPAARRLIASHRGGPVHLTLHRASVYRDVAVALSLPADTVNELAPLPTRDGVSVPSCGDALALTTPRRSPTP